MKKTISAIAALMIAASMLSGCTITIPFDELSAASEREAAASEREAAASEFETAVPEVSETEQQNTDLTIEGIKINTVADIYALDDVYEDGYGYGMGEFDLTFEYNGVYYRADGELPDDVFSALCEIKGTDEMDKAMEKGLLAGLEVKSIENLSEKILPQEELDKLVGKTAQELFDDGWECSRGFSPSDYYMKYNDVYYYASLDGSAEFPDICTSEEVEEAVKSFKVLSIEFHSV